MHDAVLLSDRQAISIQNLQNDLRKVSLYTFHSRFLWQIPLQMSPCLLWTSLFATKYACKYSFLFRRRQGYHNDQFLSTGHTYVTYGPLLNGATQVIFEGIPTYPDAGRAWDLTDKYNINILYTAPTGDTLQSTTM